MLAINGCHTNVSDFPTGSGACCWFNSNTIYCIGTCSFYFCSLQAKGIKSLVSLIRYQTQDIKIINATSIVFHVDIGQHDFEPQLEIDTSNIAKLMPMVKLHNKSKY